MLCGHLGLAPDLFLPTWCYIIPWPIRDGPSPGQPGACDLDGGVLLRAQFLWLQFLDPFPESFLEPRSPRPRPSVWALAVAWPGKEVAPAKAREPPPGWGSPPPSHSSIVLSTSARWTPEGGPGPPSPVGVQRAPAAPEGELPFDEAPGRRALTPCSLSSFWQQ